MLRLICLLQAAAGAAAGGTMGGWAEQAELGPTSHAHRLAEYALAGLQGQGINMVGFDDASVVRVTGWRSQVVAGKNHEIVAETSVGTLTLKMYEQSWTNTLKVTSATLSHPVSDISMAIITTTLVDEDGEALALDGAAFNACVPNPHAMCTREYRPMCGKDGVTYSNPCLARAACQPDATEGKCKEPTANPRPCVPDPATICTMDYSPVCGTDGKTYSNGCVARAACQLDTTKGECPPTPTPTPSVGPVSTLRSALLLGGAPMSGNSYGGHYASEMRHIEVGGACTLSGTRGLPPVPCVEGATCKITDAGQPSLDLPNSGVCTAKAEEAKGAKEGAGQPSAGQPAPAAVPASLPGGWAKVSETGSDSHVHRLARLALLGLQTCASLRSTVEAPDSCPEAPHGALARVRSARSQVVAGINYEIDVEMSVEGCNATHLLALRMFEQVWKKTLQITEATLRRPASRTDGTIVAIKLIDAERAAFPLDQDALEAAARPEQPSELELEDLETVETPPNVEMAAAAASHSELAVGGVLLLVGVLGGFAVAKLRRSSSSAAMTDGLRNPRMPRSDELPASDERGVKVVDDKLPL